MVVHQVGDPRVAVALRGMGGIMLAQKQQQHRVAYNAALMVCLRSKADGWRKFAALDASFSQDFSYSTYNPKRGRLPVPRGQTAFSGSTGRMRVGRDGRCHCCSALCKQRVGGYKCVLLPATACFYTARSA